MTASGSNTAAGIISALGLAPHPEGGHFRETFRDPRTDPSGRSVSTAIYFLLGQGEVSRWHRVDAAEVWHWYGGDPLALSLAPQAASAPATHVLGNDLGLGHRPQLVVPAGHWQQARSLGAWTLVGCTVAPGFEFSGFEMAPHDFTPTRD
jgi:predicted cupin superfamily sugar epimerase